MSAHRDRGTFERFVRAHHAAVYRAAYRVARREEEARDATQDVFLDVLAGKVDLSAAEDPERLLRWLAVKRALTRLRGERNRKIREDRVATQTQDRSSAPAAEAADARGALWSEVAALPFELRVPVELRFQEGLTYQAIGDALGVSEPSAHERVRKALETLRGRLSRLGFAAFAVDLERELAAESAVPVPGGLERSLLSLAGAASSAAPAALFLPLAAGVVVIAGGAALAAFLATRGDEPETRAAAIAPAAERAAEPVDDLARVAVGAAGEARSAAGAAGAAPVVEGDDPASPAPAGFIEGRVADLDGIAVAGVEVSAWSLSVQGKGEHVKGEAVSDLDGVWRVEVPANPDGHPYRMFAAHDDFVSYHSKETVRVLPGETVRFPVMTVLRRSDEVPGEYELEVSVVDEGGAPVAGVQVTVYRRWDPPADDAAWYQYSEGAALTGASGIAALTGRYLGDKVVAVAGARLGYEQRLSSTAIPWAGAHDLEVVLGRGLSITGRLLDAAGSPVEDVTVQARRGGGPGDDWLAAEIEADGSFALRGLEAGAAYHVFTQESRAFGGDAPFELSPFLPPGATAPAEPYEWGWSTAFLRSVPAGTADLEIVLKRANDTVTRGPFRPEVHGRLSDAVTGEPVAADHEAVEVDWIAAGATEEELRDDMYPGSLWPRPVQRMMDSSPPPPSSEFHLAGLSPGSFLIAARVRGYATAFAGPFHLGIGDVVSEIELRLERPASLSGRVLDTDGSAFAGAHLMLTGIGPHSDARIASLDQELRDTNGSSDWYYESLGKCGEDGAFAFTHLAPGLRYRIVALHPEREPAWIVAGELAAGAERDGLELRFTARRER